MSKVILEINMSVDELFFSEDSVPYNYRLAVQDVQNGLLSFGLTANQAKVYIHLAKNGNKTAPQISKVLKIPRTETYHLLKILQNKGIITATFGHPTEFEALSFDKCLSVLLSSEKERLQEMEEKKEELLIQWNKIPTFGSTDDGKGENKFQVIQGKAPILNKFKSLIEGAKDSLTMLGTEEDYLKFYHTEFPNFIKKTKAEIRILTTGNKGSEFVFSNLSQNNIKQFVPEEQEELCFIIKDKQEGLFFIKNQKSVKEFVAVWTDSNTLISSLRMLFDLIWSRANFLQTKNTDYQSSSNYEHGLKEIEQEKKILQFLYQKYPDLKPDDLK